MPTDMIEMKPGSDKKKLAERRKELGKIIATQGMVHDEADELKKKIPLSQMLSEVSRWLFRGT